MNTQEATQDILLRMELGYFGKVTASVTHELRNVLAILNETAGLLHDHACMAENGQTPDPARMRRFTENMAAQISRGDAIIRRLNRFAHSADRVTAEVDLVSLVDMVIELFARTASNRGAVIHLEKPVDSLMIDTRPFALESLLGSLLDGLTEAHPQLGAIGMSVIPADRQIGLQAPAACAATIQALLGSPGIHALLSLLSASTQLNPDSGQLRIGLPPRIGA